jgi:nitric oxide reductase NorD protein
LTSILQDFQHIPPEYLAAAGASRADASQFVSPPDNDSTSTRSSDTTDASNVMHYPEWDFRRRHYRKNWCALREIEMQPSSEPFVEQTLTRYRGLVVALRRTFEALRDGNKRLRHQISGDNIDLDALITAHADAAAGHEMSDQLFTQHRRIDRDIAVMFMVDVSGSTKGWVNEAERESLVLLCEALEILGDRYAIYGFSGMTRKRCELYRIKRFDDDYGADVRARISGIKPQDYTRMGVIIRHLTRLLNTVEARTRLLITLSDGKPDDYDGYRGEYGIEDTRQALLEAKHTGVHPFCITIDHRGHDYLPHMYGAVNYTVIEDVRQLPVRVSDIYRRLTA